MRMFIHCLVIAAILSIGLPAVWAQDVSAAQTDEQAQQEQLKKQMDILRNNVAALQGKQARVAVLRQLLEEELSDLRQMQAVFCDQYNLNPDKFRAGLYRFNEELNRFEEMQLAPDGTMVPVTEQKDESATEDSEE